MGYSWIYMEWDILGYIWNEVFLDIYGMGYPWIYIEWDILIIQVCTAIII